MSTASVPNPFEAPQLPESEDRPRYIVGRWQEYQGEDYIWGLCWALDRGRTQRARAALS